ncbi:MAG TPA: TolC family protein [Novosphingobium sp.]|nr:TolC family protein [Novosphingobium sp.]
MTLLTLAAWPFHVTAMTLEEAVATGLERHPEIAAAAAEIRAAKTDVDVAKAGYLPSVSISGGPQDVSPDEWAYDVTAAQMLHDWGQVKSQVRGARATQRQRQEEWLVARDTATLDIVETYLDLLLARRQREVDLAQIATLEDFAQMTGLRAQGGYADRSEPDRSQLELARARQRLASDEGLIADAASQFQTLVGTAPEDLVEPAPKSMIQAIAAEDTDALIDAAPLYRKTVEDTNHARAEYDETRSSILPRVNLEATALSREIGGHMESDSVVAIRLRMNPMQGLSSLHRVEGAGQRVDAAQWKEGAARRDIERRLRNMTTNGTALADQEQALERQVSSAGELGGLYREQFEVGRRDIIDLITIQREHYDARRSLNEVHLQLIRVQYQIAAQLGRLTDLFELEGA